MPKYKKWSIIGFVFTVLIGALIHFMFKWSGELPVVGAITAVNESVWEHLKLLAIPMLIFSIVEYFVYGRSRTGTTLIRGLSILAGMLCIIVVFYTYTGIVGDHFLFVDIAIFILGAALAYWLGYKLLVSQSFPGRHATLLGWLLLLAILACFVLFTFLPPQIGLFENPPTGTYGIPAR